MVGGAENLDVESDWDHLDDATWNNRLDEKIAQMNEAKGGVMLPPAPDAIMDNEYERGILNKLVTEDLIRHFSAAIGDPNPIWRNQTYARGTRWGGIIAPPTFDSCISYGTSFGETLRVPGLSRMAGGHKHEYFKPFRPGDSFSVYDQYDGIEEKNVRNKPYRMFVESSPRFYQNQRDELVAIGTARTIYLATPPGRRVENKEQPYADKKRMPLTPEQLDFVHANYEDQLAGTFRRGAKVRYWEDVVEGEHLGLIAKGPYDVCDAGARATAGSYPYAFAVKWAAMRKHLQHHPIDPETGAYRFRRDWHFDDHVAQLMGVPYANASGIHNEMMLVHLVTDWMGDDGFVRVFDAQVRRMNFFGDVTYVKGKVKRKFIENNERLVELDVWGENQHQIVHTTAAVVVKLVSRSR